MSAFGFVGTNAHVVLESFDADAQLSQARRDAHLLTLSASNEAAFDELRNRYLENLGTPADVADICFTANTGRSHLPFRAAIVAGDRAALKEKLAAATPERAPADPPRVAFLFTGQGSQQKDAGRRLYEVEPVFRAALDRCDEILRPELQRALPDLLFGDAFPLLEQTRYAQPALVALEVALFNSGDRGASLHRSP